MEKVLFRTRTYVMLRVPLLLMLGLALLSTAAYAQGSGTILGTVTDPTGAAVASAKVTITNVENGFVRSTESNQTGNFIATNLGIGRYKIHVEAPGFKAYDKTDLALTVGDTVRANAVLEVGTAVETVTVEASALHVQSETHDVSQTITGAQVTQLATNGRNVLQLTALVPGASSTMPDFDVPIAQYQNRNVYFNGQRQDHNQWVIDGGEAYDRGGGGILIVAPSQDAIAEFKVTTSNYSADLGNAAGGMITMAIKQGTKQYHGSAWEYDRNDWLNAYSWGSKNRSDPQNATKNVMRYNAWGFNFGGPMNPKAKDPKTYFFYNMEWRRLKQGSTSNQRALTAAQRNGANGVYDLTGILNAGKTVTMPHTLSTAEQQRWAAAGLTWVADAPFPNNQIPAALVNANAKAFLATGNFPVANAVSSGNQVYLTDASKRDIYREEAVRIDRQFTDKWTVMGHLLWDNGLEHLATPLWQGMTYPTVGTDAGVPSWSGVVRSTYTISPTLLNETIFNTNGNNLNINPAANGGTYLIPSGWNATGFFPDINTVKKLPGINIGGGSSGAFGMNYDIGRWPWTNTWRSYEIKDDVSWSHGKHNIRFGGGFLWNKKMQFTDANVGGNYGFNGSATGSGYADFLLGYASSYSQPQWRDAVNIAARTYSLYGIDDWKVSSRLTLNLGLRWEGIPPAWDVNGRLSNFYPELYNSAQAARWVGTSGNSIDPTGPGFTKVSGVPLSNVPFYMNGIGMAGKNGIPKGMVDTYWGTFAPRVGFAYDVTGKGTVLRGGFGMSYERTAGNEQYNMMNLVPFIYTPSVSNVLLNDPHISYQDGSTSASSYGVASLSYGALRYHKIPTVNMWNLGIQQDLQGKAVLSVAYVGNTGYHLTDTITINDLAESDTANRLAVCSSTVCTGGGGKNANLYRPYVGWGQLNMVENAANSKYNSLQVSLASKQWKNLTLGAAWTYAHGFDLVDGDLWNALDNPFNKAYNWGSSGFDRRHVVNITYVYDLPFFTHAASRAARAVLGGWTISGVTMFASGTPITINNGLDNLGYGGATNNHAQQVSAVTYPKTKDAWFSASSFARLTPAQALTWGSSPRGAVIGPGRNNWNIALFKNFQFTERVGFELRTETFNTFNHTQYTAVNSNVGDPANMGKVTGAADPRIFQLGGRLHF